MPTPEAQARREAAELVRAVAEPQVKGELVKVAIARAASVLGWSYSRTEDIWRSEARRIEAHEMDQLRRVMAARVIPKE
jgi:hypothetical protein